MLDLIATQGFDDDRLGDVKRGQRFSLSPFIAKAYQDNGLLREVGGSANPMKASGITSSASPAGQALPEKTAEQSKRGRKAKQATALLLPTAHS